MKRLKLLIKLKYYKFKMDWYNKRWNVSRKREEDLRNKSYKASSVYYYAYEKIHPEEIWEARAEREFERLNL